MIFIDELKAQFTQKNNTLIQLILINVVVFVTVSLAKVILHIVGLKEYSSISTYFLEMPLSASEFIFKPWTLFTYFFLHEEIFHILGNMLMLYYFGKLITEYLGHKRLVSIYILGGITAGVFALLIFNTIPYFHSHPSFYGNMLGASGAVYAVVVAAAVLLPDYSFYLILIGPVKIKYFAAFFIFLSILGTIEHNPGGNLAHLGGAAMGFVFVKQLKAGNDLGKWINQLLGFVANIFKPKPKMKVTYRNTSATANQSKVVYRSDQEEIDAILDKISKSGYESLSKEEKQKLFSASQK